MIAILMWFRSWIRSAAGDRRLLWPIRLNWGDMSSSCWFGRHSWYVGPETNYPGSLSCIPGWRQVYGQTIHFGRLKVCFGKQWSAIVQPHDAAAYAELFRAIWREGRN